MILRSFEATPLPTHVKKSLELHVRAHTNNSTAAAEKFLRETPDTVHDSGYHPLVRKG